MVTLTLTENEAKVIMNALWLSLREISNRASALNSPYREWLNSAHDKVRAALPKPPEFAENH